MINFGLDYDGTITEDPILWRSFIATAKQRGHNVFIITARGPDEIAEIEHLNWGVEIIPCSGDYKNRVCEANALSIDVWIDDMPQIIMEEAWQPN